MQRCKYCDRALPASRPGGHRPREFCDNAHKQAFYRRLHAPAVEPSAGLDQAQAEALERDLAAANERIAQLEMEITHLRTLLDVERRFYQDTQARGLKTWMKKQAGALPTVGKKLLGEAWLMPRGSRAMYEAHLRQAGYSSDELAEFRDLWKRMLVEQP